MNRRNFLKALAATFGSAAIPATLVEACQIDAPIPKDWIVGLLDIDGNVFAQMEADSFENVTFPVFTRPGVVTHGFVDGAELGGRRVIPLNQKAIYVLAGDTIILTTHLADYSAKSVPHNPSD